MTTHNTELKKALHTQLSALEATAAEKILAHINSLPELAQMNITVRYETVNSFSHRQGWFFNSTDYRFETRFTLVPALEKTFGTEIELTCNKDGLSMNYGTCGKQNLGSDIGFIQKNLLIGLLTLHQSDIKEFIMNLAEILEANEVLDKISDIADAEWEAELAARAAERLAEEEAAAKAKAEKEAEKKAKAAERRKARRAARRAAQN
jgi:hypothetical protein